MEVYGALVAAAPKNNSRRAWSEADRRWASGKRQIIEGVIGQLKDFFGSGASSCEDVGRAADASGRQGCGLHLRTTHQRLPRPTAAPPGGPVDLAHCTSQSRTTSGRQPLSRGEHRTARNNFAADAMEVRIFPGWLRLSRNRDLACVLLTPGPTRRERCGGPPRRCCRRGRTRRRRSSLRGTRV